MAFETGTATSHEDFFNQLSTFAVANGWTEDEHDTVNDEIALSLSTIFVSFRYDNTDNISIHQALGFTPGNTPGNHPDDSGNGDKSGAITTQRRWNVIGAGPFVRHFFFTDGNPGTYLHVVLEYAAGLYRHMIFGEIVKLSAWTGGEYCAGHIWTPGTNSDNLQHTGHSLLFDSRGNVNTDGATLHIEGLASGPASSKWGVCFSGTAPGNDTAGNGREALIGGMRDSFLHAAIGHIQKNPNNGFVPLIPMKIYRRLTAPAPDTWMPMGTLPDIRAVNINFMEPADEFSLGPDTWKVFPWTRKRFAQDNTEESGNMGIAYKKIV